MAASGHEDAFPRPRLPAFGWVRRPSPERQAMGKTRRNQPFACHGSNFPRWSPVGVPPAAPEQASENPSPRLDYDRFNSLYDPQRSPARSPRQRAKLRMAEVLCPCRCCESAGGRRGRVPGPRGTSRRCNPRACARVFGLRKTQKRMVHDYLSWPADGLDPYRLAAQTQVVRVIAMVAAKVGGEAAREGRSATRPRPAYKGVRVRGTPRADIARSVGTNQRLLGEILGRHGRGGRKLVGTRKMRV
jgi:hypothetical protein